jgi:hypothetical protein
VVLAAGLSTRYGRLKQLDPMGPDGEAIMDYNVFDAARAGFHRVIFIVREEIEDEIRRHVAAVVGDAIDVAYVRQALDALPDGFRAPPDRARPWGTAHAVLCAADALDGPFAVCNADDLYGPGAFRLLHEYLASDPVPTEGALIGYELLDTLSGAGGVARGVCVLRSDRLLERVTEVRQIRKIDGWITGVGTNDEPVELTGDEIVSMNLWGFTPTIVAHMRRQFRRFLEHWGADTAHEFFLSTAVNGQVEVGAARLSVLPAPDRWFGVTHAADREMATTTLADRVESGVYPPSLTTGFTELG